MSRRTVKHDIDLANLPPLMVEQGAELEALRPSRGWTRRAGATPGS